MKVFVEGILDNKSLVGKFCEIAGVQNKNELILNYGFADFQTQLDAFINYGADESGTFDMTVYIKENEIIGREITFSSVDYFENVNLKTYSIPDEKGQLGYFEFKQDEENVSVIFKDEESDGVHKGESKFITGGEGFELSYDNFAVSDELFQGNVNFDIVNSDEFSALVELTKEDEGKRVNISVLNICDVSVLLTPSELEFKEVPMLFEGEYADFGDSDYDGKSAELRERFLGDISRFSWI